MMDKDQSHLRLLPALATHPPKDQSIQSTLFPMAAAGQTVAYALMGDSHCRPLTDVLEWLRPRWVIDLRPLPRFDFGTLNRRKAFRYFHRVSAAYHDLFGSLGFRTRSEAAMHLDTVAEAVAMIVGQQGATGPILVLVDEPPSADEAACLPRRLGKKWEMLLLSDAR